VNNFFLNTHRLMGVLLRSIEVPMRKQAYKSYRRIFSLHVKIPILWYGYRVWV